MEAVLHGQAVGAADGGALQVVRVVAEPRVKVQAARVPFWEVLFCEPAGLQQVPGEQQPGLTAADAGGPPYCEAGSDNVDFVIYAAALSVGSDYPNTGADTSVMVPVPEQRCDSSGSIRSGVVPSHVPNAVPSGVALWRPNHESTPGADGSSAPEYVECTAVRNKGQQPPRGRCTRNWHTRRR
mgnify:CR=1 FL=1